MTDEIAQKWKEYAELERVWVVTDCAMKVRLERKKAEIEAAQLAEARKDAQEIQ